MSPGDRGGPAVDDVAGPVVRVRGEVRQRVPETDDDAGRPDAAPLRALVQDQAAAVLRETQQFSVALDQGASRRAGTGRRRGPSATARTRTSASPSST